MFFLLSWQPWFSEKNCNHSYNPLASQAFLIWTCLISSHIIATDMRPEGGQLTMWPWTSHFSFQNVNTLPNLLSDQLYHEIKSPIIPLSLILLQVSILQTYWTKSFGIYKRTAILVLKLQEKVEISGFGRRLQGHSTWGKDQIMSLQIAIVIHSSI